MPKISAQEYKTKIEPVWCPGCGDFGVLQAICNALSAKDVDPKNLVFTSGIGCSGRLPPYVKSYGFHTVHGRVLPGMDVSATTLVTHLLLDLWIYGAVLIIGIALQPLRAVRLLPAAMAGLGLLLWLDIPLVLLGSIEGLLLQHLAPDRLDTDPWVLWHQFLTQGGRMVLALGLGLLVLGVGRKR